MKNTIHLLFCFISLHTLSYAQELNRKEIRETKKVEPPHKGSIYFTPIPIIGSNPSFGILYGVATSTSWYMGDPSSTRISSLFTGLTFTSKGQTLITLKANVFSENNNYKLDIDWRFLNSSQGTFGLGSGPSSNKLASSGFEYNDLGALSSPINQAQMLEFHWIRLHQTLSKKITNGFYLGLGYHLDALSKVKDNLLNLSTTPPIITSYYAYNTKYGFSNEKSTLSGFSLNGIYDTRDNINSARKGHYALLKFVVNPTFLGSDKNSTALWAEYRKYFDFSKNHKNILAFWTYGSFQTSGNMPYMNLPALGYDQYSGSGRGYTQGKIRGQALFYSELEFRRKLFGTKKNPDQWGINIFTNITTATNNDANIKLFQYIDPSIGAGLRFMVNTKSRTTVCLDYAIGKYNSSGIYLGLNEFF